MVDKYVSRKEFEDLITDMANMLEVFAVTVETMREGLAKTSVKLRGFKIFYCRKWIEEIEVFCQYLSLQK